MLFFQPLKELSIIDIDIYDYIIVSLFNSPIIFSHSHNKLKNEIENKLIKLLIRELDHSFSYIWLPY